MSNEDPSAETGSRRCERCRRTTGVYGSLCLDCADALVAELRAKVTARREAAGRHRPRGYAPWNPQPKTRALLRNVREIIGEYSEHLPLTVRQIFYRLVGVYGYDKTELAYNRLAEALVRARRARLIPFHYLRDDGVGVISHEAFDSVESFFDDVGRRAKLYRRDKQAGQPVYVELWTEAAGMQPQLARVANDYSVPVYSAGGFASLTAVSAIVSRARSRDVPTVILHVGDYDPSGESIFGAMADDAAAFLADDAMRLPGVHYLDAERVALTAEQVAQYDLPTAPPKATDSRSKRWEGETCQAEALPPDRLAAVVREAVESRLDVNVLREHRDAEAADRTAILRSLPRPAEDD
jgi:hypothetical protein